MNNTVITERELRPMNGILGLLLCIVGVLCGVGLIITAATSGLSILLTVALILLSVLIILVASIGLGGLRVVQPNEALVLTLFGKYHGTIKTEGFFMVNPFSVGVNPNCKSITEQLSDELNTVKGKKGSDKTTRKQISLKTRTLLNDKQKVNDLLGNPIIIGAVVLWRVENATDAVFKVENYMDYLSTQADSTIRNVARLYPYDLMDAEESETEATLRGSSQLVAEQMRTELQERAKDAGILIEEVRITHLSYSEEIAAAMLQRQQATALISARQKIVDGAVGMVKIALEKLGEDEIVVMDDERKAQMVSNLLVVLCGNKDAQPIVNSGSIY